MKPMSAPSGEGLLVAGDDDAADVFVGFEGVDRRTDAIDDLIVQRIHRFRAVDADQADLADHFAEDYLGHVCSPEKWPLWGRPN
jgi:hypothetical protein